MADAEFVPLRTDPPPPLRTTLWIRSALASAILLTALAVLASELVPASGVDAVGRVASTLHIAVLVLLIIWSDGAMSNVDHLVPATRYSATAHGWQAGMLWLVAFAAPAGAAAVAGRVGDRFADVEAFLPTSLTIGAVLVALFVAWLPFSYHARQARRIGVPRATLLLWFWAPLLTFVGGLVVLAFTSPTPLDGAEPIERGVGVGAVYGLAAAVFGWSTWRAVTVFDEVIDLRWQRWRSEWEQTLVDLASQPPPAPEPGWSR